MASGDTLAVFTPHANQPPTASYATLDTRNDHLVLDFDADADEAALFGGVLDRAYDGGGITVTLYWMATTATTGTVRWDVSIERHADDAFDLDGDGFATAKSVTATTANVSGEVAYDTVAFTSGAEMDSLVVGESFRIRINRDADNGSSLDTMTGDAELLRLEIQET